MTCSALEVAIALGAFGLVYVASLVHRREQDAGDERRPVRRGRPSAVHWPSRDTTPSAPEPNWLAPTA